VVNFTIDDAVDNTVSYTVKKKAPPGIPGGAFAASVNVITARRTLT
jgi:hypothetical protein